MASTITPPFTGTAPRRGASYGRCLTGSHNNIHRIALLPDGGVEQSTVLTVTAPTDATLYAFTISDSRTPAEGGSGATITVSATSSGTDPDDLIAQFVVDLEADANTALLLDYTVAAGTITFVALEGVTLIYTETADSTNDLAFVTTAASDAPQYTFGRVVTRTALASGAVSADLLAEKAVFPASGDSPADFCLVLDYGYQGISNVGIARTITDVTGPLPGVTLLAAPLATKSLQYSVEATSSDIVKGDPVYVGTEPAELGRVYRATGTGRIAWTGCTFHSLDAADPTVAYIQL